jgi:hypothetical protein
LKLEEFGQDRGLIPPLFNPREQILDSVGFCSYTGPSMNPILREGDLLEVKGYGCEPIRIGDVILFKKESVSGIVVHRVIGLSNNGLVTRGDNNIEEDLGLLDSRDVIGRVIAAWRGQRRREVLGGMAGIIMAGFTGTRNKLTAAIFDFLAPCYRFVSSRGFLRWLSILAEPKIVKFGDKDLKLMFGSHEIGRSKEGLGWFIRPPFKLIIEEASLPEVAESDDLP